jgi:hypothetical protein
MTAQFHEDGIRFQYPENWVLERQDTDAGWTVTVQSLGTAFVLLSYDAEMPEAELMADTALEALRSDYPSLESAKAVESLAGLPAVGHDVQFFAFDLTNTCWLRSFDSGTGTVLVMWQANDLELDRLGPVLRAICASITVDEE